MSKFLLDDPARPSCCGKPMHRNGKNRFGEDSYRCSKCGHALTPNKGERKPRKTEDERKKDNLARWARWHASHAEEYAQYKKGWYQKKRLSQGLLEAKRCACGRQLYGNKRKQHGVCSYCDPNYKISSQEC